MSPVNWLAARWRALRLDRFPISGRDAPAQLVVGHADILDVLQIPQSRENAPPDPPGVQPQERHMPAYNLHPVPIARRGRLQPVGVVRPVRPIRAVVQGDQSLALVAGDLGDVLAVKVICRRCETCLPSPFSHASRRTTCHRPQEQPNDLGHDQKPLHACHRVVSLSITPCLCQPTKKARSPQEGCAAHRKSPAARAPGR